MTKRKLNYKQRRCLLRLLWIPAASSELAAGLRDRSLITTFGWYVDDRRAYRLYTLTPRGVAVATQLRDRLHDQYMVTTMKMAPEAPKKGRIR